MNKKIVVTIISIIIAMAAPPAQATETLQNCEFTTINQWSTHTGTKVFIETESGAIYTMENIEDEMEEVNKIKVDSPVVNHWTVPEHTSIIFQDHCETVEIIEPTQNAETEQPTTTQKENEHTPTTVTQPSTTVETPEETTTTIIDESHKNDEPGHMPPAPVMEGIEPTYTG